MTDVVSPLEKSQNICVYCGSSSGNGPEFAAEAIALGRALATQNLGLVYGGGRVGLMGLVADAVLDNDGLVHGIIPEHLVRAETAHQGLTTLEMVATMHERKAHGRAVSWLHRVARRLWHL